MMNKTISLIVILIIGYSQYGYSQTEKYSMSLTEAVDYAILHNQNLANAKLEIAAAEGFVREYIAVGYPQISGSIDLANNYNLPTSFLPAEIVGGPAGETVPVQFGTPFSGNATLSATQMVFDGVFFVGLKAARTFEELSTKAHIKTKIDIVEAVNKAYYNVLVSKLSLELIEKNYGRLDTLLADTKIMNINGFVERIDVSRVQVQYNNIKVNLDNSRNLLLVAESLLKFQMGMPIKASLTLTDQLSLDMFEDSDAEAFKYEQRIEYSILQTEERLAALNIKRNNVAYMPSIELYANIGALAGTGATASLFNIGNNWFDFGIVGLRMKIPIFDGLQKHRINQQRQIKLAQVHNNFDLLKNSINLELERTRVAYENSVNYMNVQMENVKISEEVYNVTKTKYQQGVGSNIEVINADAEFKAAQTNFFTSLYTALLAKVDYDKALGKLNY